MRKAPAPHPDGFGKRLGADEARPRLVAKRHPAASMRRRRRSRTVSARVSPGSSTIGLAWSSSLRSRLTIAFNSASPS
jgi:hypothetical protein